MSRYFRSLITAAEELASNDVFFVSASKWAPTLTALFSFSLFEVGQRQEIHDPVRTSGRLSTGRILAIASVTCT